MGFCSGDPIREDINEQVPHFPEILQEFWHHCFEISMEILKVLAIALNLPADFFDKNHLLSDSPNTIRLLHYPPLSENISPGTVRLAEHSDYGTITLLFQDGIGSLEICGRDGKFITVTPVPDAVLVNTGDLLQRLTSDRILAVRHRILIVEEERLYHSHRRSIAYFVYPKGDSVVKPFDGSTKYEPVTAKEYLMNKFKKLY